MAKKIDPLNKKNINAATPMIVVKDIKAAMGFCQKAFGYKKRGVANGPDGKPMHAEMRLRDSVLMLSPEYPDHGMRSANTLMGTPVTMYLMTENADKVFAKAVKLGAKALQPVMDMFWGDRVGTVVDPDGYTWMVGTHIAEPTPPEMNKKMKEQMAAMASHAEAGG